MRSVSLKLAGLLCLLVVASTALSAANAFALPETLGSSTFTATSKEGELTTASGLAIKCKADKASGETVGTTELTANVTFEKCSIAGLAAQSLSDKGGVILLSSLKGHLCYINKSTTDVGVLFTLPSAGVHIEVPSLGSLLVVTGSVVGLISPPNAKGKAFTLTFPKTPLTCEGATGNEDVLLVELEHSGKTEVGTEVTTESIETTKEIEIMA